jgi:hypothetical protein
MVFFVKRVVDNGTASTDARLRVGDQILELNGHSFNGVSHEVHMYLCTAYRWPRICLFVLKRKSPELTRTPFLLQVASAALSQSGLAIRLQVVFNPEGMEYLLQVRWAIILGGVES